MWRGLNCDWSRNDGRWCAHRFNNRGSFLTRLAWWARTARRLSHRCDIRIKLRLDAFWHIAQGFDRFARFGRQGFAIFTTILATTATATATTTTVFTAFSIIAQFGFRDELAIFANFARTCEGCARDNWLRRIKRHRAAIGC